MKKLLVISEAAEILRCSKKTVYRLVSEGELEALHVRGSLRVTQSSIDVYIDEQIARFQEQNGRYKHAAPAPPQEPDMGDYLEKSDVLQVSVV